MREALSTCVLCPRLCRHACPVATGTGREAAVPTRIADVVYAWELGEVEAVDALAAASLCVDCGACQAACHLHRPLPDLLATVRATLTPRPRVAPPGDVAGEGGHVAVLHDDRDWSGALAARLGAPVATLRTPDALGHALRGHEGWHDHLDAVRARLAGRVAVVAHGGVAAVLRAAGVEVRWLHDLAGLEARPGCASGGPPASCCGGAAPLVHAHPDDARVMASRWAPGPVADARCAAHLRACDVAAPDAVDLLLEGP